MELATYSSIKTKLENDLDIQDADFVTETELLGYMNEAIDDAETLIHTLGLEANYFKTVDTLTLVNGTSDYSMPSDIYANKILGVYYMNGARKYKVVRRRNQDDVLNDVTGADYEYDIFNLSTGIIQRFYPTPAESGAYISRYYIRNVRKLTTSTAASNTCELPESLNFLYQHVKMRIYEKEGNPNLQKAMADVRTQYDLMAQTLREMVPDGDNLIIPDLSYYQDTNPFYGGY